MTRGHVYKKLTEIMQTIENINIYEMSSSTMRRLNQQKINKAYKQLDNIKEEIEREYIKNKQKRRNEK